MSNGLELDGKTRGLLSVIFSDNVPEAGAHFRHSAGTPSVDRAITIGFGPSAPAA